MATRRRAAAGAVAATPRLQQPTDSPAASLPNETLAHIFELSLERMKPWDKQLARISFGNVCYTWYGVALPLRDCVVPDSKRAEDLAAVLKRGRMGERPVRGLDVEVEVSGSGRGPRFAKLLRQCAPGLQSLRFSIGSGAFLSSAHGLRKEGPFGKPVLDALKMLRSLVHVEFELVGRLPFSVLDRQARRTRSTAPRADHQLLHSFFTSWPHLRDLMISDVHIEAPSTSTSFKSPPALRKLRIFADAFASSLQRCLISSSSSTLTFLELGPVPALSMEEILARLRPILPQLTTFSMIDGPGYALTGTPPARLDTSAPVEAALKQMKAVRHLTVGVHAIDFQKLFDLLPELKQLSNFTLDVHVHSDRIILDHLSSWTVARYIDSASPVLKTMGFPAELTSEGYWDVEDEEEAIWTATVNRVKTRWITKVDPGQRLEE